MKETRVVEKILHSLQKKFHYVVIVIEQSHNMNFFFDKLRSHGKTTSP